MERPHRNYTGPCAAFTVNRRGQVGTDNVNREEELGLEVNFPPTRPGNVFTTHGNREDLKSSHALAGACRGADWIHRRRVSNWRVPVPKNAFVRAEFVSGRTHTLGLVAAPVGRVSRRMLLRRGLMRGSPHRRHRARRAYARMLKARWPKLCPARSSALEWGKRAKPLANRHPLTSHRSIRFRPALHKTIWVEISRNQLASH